MYREIDKVYILLQYFTSDHEQQNVAKILSTMFYRFGVGMLVVTYYQW